MATNASQRQQEGSVHTNGNNGDATEIDGAALDRDSLRLSFGKLGEKLHMNGDETDHHASCKYRLYRHDRLTEEKIQCILLLMFPVLFFN